MSLFIKRIFDFVANKLGAYKLTYYAAAKSYDKAIALLSSHPDPSILPVNLRYRLARCCYDERSYPLSMEMLDSVQDEYGDEVGHKALRMGVLIGLQDFDALNERVTSDFVADEEMDWLLQRFEEELTNYVDAQSYGKATALLSSHPNPSILPVNLRYRLARCCYDERSYPLSKEMLDSVQDEYGDEVGHKALRMGVLIGLQDFDTFNKQMTSDFFADEEMDWLLQRFEEELTNFVDTQSYDKSLDVLNNLEANELLFEEIKFQKTRLLFDNGLSHEALGQVLQLLSVQPNNGKYTALYLGVLVSLHKWDDFEKVLVEDFSYQGNEWVLQKFTSEVKSINDETLTLFHEAIYEKLQDKYYRRKSITPKINFVKSMLRANNYELSFKLALKLHQKHPDIKGLHLLMVRSAFQRKKWILDVDVFEGYLNSFKKENYFYEKVQLAFKALKDFMLDSKVPLSISNGRNVDHILDVIYRNQTILKYKPNPKNTVVLVGANMAAGGAEHVLVNAHVGLGESKEVDNYLWLHDVDSISGRDHFLKQYGLTEMSTHQIKVLENDVEPVYPFNIIGGYVGRQAHNIYKELLVTKPSVLHAWQDSTNIECALAGIMAGVPKIILHPHNMRPDLVHNTEICKSFHVAYTALLQRDNVHLICCSRASLDDYLDWLGMPMSKNMHVVYNGFKKPILTLRDRISFSKFYLRDELKIDPTNRVVAGIFRFNEVKQPLFWLEVAEIVCNKLPDVSFVIFGQGELMPDAIKFVDSRNLGGQIKLGGRVQNAMKHSAACDLLLHTSRSEGLPTILIEALMNGVPVVASNVGGSRECFREQDSSIYSLIDGFKASDYADEVIRMLDSQLPYKDKHAIGAKTEKLFGVRQMVQGFEKIYEG